MIQKTLVILYELDKVLFKDAEIPFYSTKDLT